MISIEEINLLIEKLEKLRSTDFEKLIKTNLNDLKLIKEVIERKDKESKTFLSKGAAWFREDLREKAKKPKNELMYKSIKDKIYHFAKTNMYNSLEIGPGNAEFSNIFTAWNKQFYLDIMWEIEKNVRKKFNLAHQKHIRYYKTDGFHCGAIPQGTVNFIFSWDTFVFFNIEQIDNYLLSMENILIPGGYVFIQYADCHFDYDLQMSKKGYWAYNNKSIMKELIEKNNLSIVEMGQFSPGNNYAIFKKFGNVNPTVYKISELELD